jgi:hypothetical protein
MDTEAATEQDIAEAVGAGAPQLLANPKRPHCARCHRPVRVCMCHALPPARLRTAGRTRVVILQSHKEATRRQQISTTPLIALCLESCSVVVERHRRQPGGVGCGSADAGVVRELRRLCGCGADGSGTAPQTPLLMFPGPGAISLQDFATRHGAGGASSGSGGSASGGSASGSNAGADDGDGDGDGAGDGDGTALLPPPSTIILIDGTWNEAKSLGRRYFPDCCVAQSLAQPEHGASACDGAGEGVPPPPPPPPPQPVQRVVLPAGGGSGYTFRKEPHVHGFDADESGGDACGFAEGDFGGAPAVGSGLCSTLECLARALPLLERGCAARVGLGVGGAAVGAATVSAEEAAAALERAFGAMVEMQVTMQVKHKQAAAGAVVPPRKAKGGAKARGGSTAASAPALPPPAQRVCAGGKPWPRKWFALCYTVPDHLGTAEAPARCLTWVEDPAGPTRVWLRQETPAKFCSYDEADTACQAANRSGRDGRPRARGRRLRVVALRDEAAAAVAAAAAAAVASAAAVAAVAAACAPL